MNWLIKFSQHIVPLSVNGLQQILEIPPEQLGQGYLFEGPGVADLRQMRSAAQFKDVVTTALEYFHTIFETLYEDIEIEQESQRQYRYDENRQIIKNEQGIPVYDTYYTNYPRPDYEPDEERVKDEIGTYADMYVADLDFTRLKEDQWESFLKYIDDDTNLPQLLKDYYEETLGKRDLPAPEALQGLWEKMTEYEQAFTNQGIPLDISVADIQAAYQTAAEDPDNVRPMEEFYETMAKFTAELFSEIWSNNEMNSWDRKEIPGDVEWVDDAQLRDKADDTFDRDSTVSDWYTEYHGADLKENAEQSISDSDTEYSKEHAREMNHRLGFDPYELFKDEYYRDIMPEEEDDERKDMSISKILSALNAMEEAGSIASSVYKVVGTTSMYTQGIKDIISSNDTLKQLFSNEINRLAPDPRAVLRGVEEAIGKSDVVIPESIRANDAIQAVMLQREQDAERQEQARQLYLQQQQQQAAEQEKYHHMLNPGAEQLSPEELQKLKELGISQRPFPHQYSLQRGSYPGSGHGGMPDFLEPFQISVSPGSEMIQGRETNEKEQDRIPRELMTELPFHTVQKTEGVPPLGWIGGYADYSEKVMYITEVQSDIMQRTPYMRDPKKVTKFWEGEVARLQDRVHRIRSKMEEPIVSPRDKLQQKIDAINKEQEQLTYMSRMGQPQDTQFQKNQVLLEKLQGQLSQMPEGADDSIRRSKSAMELEGLEEQLRDARNKMESGVQTDTDLYTSKDPGKWHDWRSKLENRFKDWIPLFFNVAIREAKGRGFEKVRIITADELMKIWAEFGGPEKKQLFERIYNRTAQQYGASSAKAYNRNWYEIDLGGEDLRYASRKQTMDNWVKRAFYKEATEWEGIDPRSNSPIWQTTLDAYFNELRPAGTHSDEEIFNLWAEIARDKMPPGFEDMARQYATEKHSLGAERAAPDAETPLTGSQALMLHTSLDKFFEVMRRESPELRGPEFETENGGWEQNENNRNIFAEWMKNAVHDLSFLFDETGDLRSAAKSVVRQHVINTQNFDPFEEEGPGEFAGLQPSEPDEGDVSPEELEAMFEGGVYDPGTTEERLRRQGYEEDVAIPPAEELDELWRQPPRR
jgi:hypothetical protein